MRRASTAVLLLALLALAAPAAGQELRAGFAVTPLPTPLGGPLAGYGGLRDRDATGLRDAPEARALVLESGDLRVAIVTLDLVIMRGALRDAILARSEGLALDTLLAVATHTHSGPGGYVPGFWAERITAGSLRVGALEELADAAAKSLQQAVDDLAPARVAVAQGRLDRARNRRDADGLNETALPVLRIDRPNRPRIAVFAYGMHPTVLSAGRLDYSADYIGETRRSLAERDWLALFLPGPLGDQGPSSELGPLGSNDPELEDRQLEEIGGALADAVLATAEPLTPRPAPLLAREGWHQPPRVRVRRFCALWWLSPLVRGSLADFLSSQVPFVALGVGDARLLGLPAELSAALGDELRARVPAPRVPFVVAHANDWLGYAVTRRRYKQGGYEACLSFHGRGLGSWLVESGAGLLDGLDARE